MRTPEGELREIGDLVSKWEVGLFPADVLAFRVAECIINNDDPELLKAVPDQISVLINGMISAFEEDGEVLSYSNLGAVDHTDLVVRLIGVLRR